MIDLKTLIQASPVPAETKQKVLAEVDSFSPEKAYEFENLCWSLLSEEYQNKLNFKLKTAMIEMAEGKKQYAQADFDKMEDDLFQELVNKLQATNNTEQINEVREKLAALKTQTPQPQNP